MLHTPGPWKVLRTEHRGCKPFHRVEGICICHDSKGQPAEANARLIAAAPELLKACEEVEEYLNGADLVVHHGSRNSRGNSGQKYSSTFPQAELLRKAIAKAKGEAL